MYDCTYEKSFLSVREWVDIIEDTSDKRIPIVIISNKIDLRDEARNAHTRTITHEQGAKLAKEYHSLFIETSAKIGTNMDESLIELCKYIYAGVFCFFEK
jgi:GTPase SAR1 family protein